MYGGVEMEKIETLEDALERIVEMEKENSDI